MKCFSLFCCFYLLISFLCALCCNAADSTITPNQPLRDGQTIVSLSESFEFGFFTPEGSKNQYVGIWYHKLKPQTIVWVANREHPLTEYSKGGVVTIGQDGNMLVLDGNGTSIWSTKASVLATDSIAMLQDSGNLILKEPNSNIFIWQSFDHPTDTFLPGMKLMMSSKQNQFLSSWRSPINPEVGIFKFGYESNKLSLWHGSITYWTSGDWNGSIFEMVPPEDALSPLFNLTKVIEGNEVYFTYSSPLNKTRLVMNVNGALEFYILDLDSWYIDWWLPKAPCDYVSCGSFGQCYYTDINLFDRFGNQRDYALCNCLRGFEPTSQKNWEAGDWSGGCKRRMPLGCDNNEEDGFISYNLMLMENTTISSYQVETAENCRLDCLHNCNCSAYAYANEKYAGATTCKIWDGDLSHVRLLDYHVQEVQELFIRMSAFEIDMKHDIGHSSSRRSLFGIVFPLTSITLILILGTIGYWWRKKSLKRKEAQRAKVILGVDKFRKNGRKDLDVPFFDFQSIAAATNNFSDSNKLGQGGFGPVYKGSLPGGQEIAVKRLSRCSGQGLEEFKTEVILIAKLQHRNLVRLLGFCVQGDEQMLLYEYMPNKSLDYFLFDQNRHTLDWEKRLSIISGIARGLLYLHQDSRLRIIHRDLKPSNILLDEMWNPKISDFGMARIFGENQTQANTNRVIGTYGYMPPEYALEGTYSEKSDVFSFGVMLLEIVSGKKNTTFYHSEHSFSLLGNAWRLWREGRGLELMDPLLNEGSNIQDVLKCIHVGLLCVQQDAADRPTMASVVAMFVGESNNLATPNKPAFFTTRSLSAVESSSHGPEICSQNEITISTLQGR